MINRLLISGLFILFIGFSVNSQTTTIPYSQWTIGNDNDHVSWHFVEGLEYNDSFIKGPEAENWNEWYNQILDFRTNVRNLIGKTEPYLCCEFPSKRKTVFHFDKFVYQLQLTPGEQITLSGKVRSSGKKIVFYINYSQKLKGKELSYDVRKRFEKTDSIVIEGSQQWTSFTKTIVVPNFDAQVYSIAPEMALNPIADQFKLLVKDITFELTQNTERQQVKNRIEAYLKSQAQNSTLKIPDKLAWTHQNYVMGFVFVWDAKFWDNKKGEYLVDEYCKTMRKEFGGIQSVVLWHSYPNIGIDERNQFEMIRNMPGGIEGLKKVVADFHKNGIKVFITYNPWDLDTNRPQHHDYVELANVLSESNADGVYLDTWRCSKGVISLFEVENSIRDEVRKRGKTVAFTTEILPEAKDLIGRDALTSSWGQEIHPYNFTDLSHFKWLMPDHKQYYIKRMLKERKPIMAHAWINGQGLQLWENIFGAMNLWSADHRKVFRKMNAVWQSLGNLYITDKWKPLMPTANKHIIASEWTNDNFVITNFVDTANAVNQLKYPVKDMGAKYYDLWNGIELKPFAENGKYFVNIAVNDFGCLLQSKVEKSKEIKALLKTQKRETARKLPAKDKYEVELSMKKPLAYKYKANKKATFETPLLHLNAVDSTLTAEHIWREGKCYPDEDAKDNHDLKLSRKNGRQFVNHSIKTQIETFGIMPRVVTNGQFEQFLNETGYKPRYKENFLKHWNGAKCPEAIKNDPVVYVCLDDARSFANWAGMQLPTEWEWQLAAEKHKNGFKFNEVYELNESLRFDGFNYSVSLRGGCSRWTTPSSLWYFPGAEKGNEVGGAQKLTSHVKYFLMYPGYDRNSTIGFRCVKR